MKFKFFTYTATAALLAALSIPARLAAQEVQQRRHLPHYTITDLGTLGGTFSEAVGINNRGSVSGDSTLPGDSVIHGFSWQKGIMTDLGTLGGPNSFAPEEWSPNERGEVAGFSDMATIDPNNENFCSTFSFINSPHICLPFAWEHGVMTTLPTLGGNNAAALAINNRGQLTGVSETGTTQTVSRIIGRYVGDLGKTRSRNCSRSPAIPRQSQEGSTTVTRPWVRREIAQVVQLRLFSGDTARR